MKPYNLFQNEVLCEVIRRRNDPSWAVVVVCKDEENDDDEQRVKHFEQNIAKCWGIGPSNLVMG